MFGWIVQWYVNWPGDENVKLNRPPGAMFPEFHPFALSTDVCVVLSLFNQLIVVPAGIVSGSMPNAPVV